jgi:myo-inositol-1(or 4)-monophosphatase
MQEKLISIIKEAGEILKEGYYSIKEPSFKGKKDLVTKYDVAVENFLKEKFSVAFGDFNIIAEESDNSEVEFCDSIIIDPIDGTTNFVNGVPHCAISVGVFKDKKPYIGVVYNPILDELYSAKIGEGAFLNGEKLQVSNDKKLEVALIATGFPYTSASDEKALEFVIKNMQTILPICQDIRRLGSASIDLCMVARGTYAGYYEINLKAWDVSAGIMILTEAGGMVSNIMGEEYEIFGNDCMVATNAFIHKELLSHLKEI